MPGPPPQLVLAEAYFCQRPGSLVSGLWRLCGFVPAGRNFLSKTSFSFSCVVEQRPRSGRRETKPGGKAAADLVAAMLGPTGNLRAPTARVGKTVVVGFNEDVYSDVLL